MTNAHRLVEVATQLAQLLRNATDAELEAAQERIGTLATSSRYASTHEPLSGVCVAIQAEQKRRLLNTPRSSSRYDAFASRVVEGCTDCRPGHPCYGHGHGF